MSLKSKPFELQAPGHDLSEFYEGGLEKGGFSKLREGQEEAGEKGGRTNIEVLFWVVFEVTVGSSNFPRRFHSKGF